MTSKAFKRFISIVLLSSTVVTVEVAAENDTSTAKQAKQRILIQAKELFEAFEDRSKLVLKPEDDARTEWTNLPVGIVARPGVSIGDMTNLQRRKTHHLLSELFSAQGYLKVTGIMHLDNILQQHFNVPRLKWSHEQYYFAFWGQPSDQQPWGFKLEGHHLSINFTYADMSISSTPMFLGTDPAEVRETEYAGWKVLGQEEEWGFRLLHSLDTDQRKTAVLADRSVPRDILTNPNSEQRLTEYWGIKAAALNSSQQIILRHLITEYLNNLEFDLAQQEISKIENAGFDDIYFAWIGDTERSDSQYYLVHGPTFIIEFDNHRNHVHSIWRSKTNDFGRDVLKEHLNNNPHP